VRARIVDADSVPVALERAELQDDMTERGWYRIAEGATEPDARSRSRSSPIADELRVRVACPRGFTVSPAFRLASLGQRGSNSGCSVGAIEGTVFGRTVRPRPGACVVLQDVLQERNQTLTTPSPRCCRSPRALPLRRGPARPHQLALVGATVRAHCGRHRGAPGAAVVQDCLAPSRAAAPLSAADHDERRTAPPARALCLARRPAAPTVSARCETGADLMRQDRVTVQAARLHLPSRARSTAASTAATTTDRSASS